MKNIFKFAFIFIAIVTFNSCDESEQTVDLLLDNEFGAVLRTIEVHSALLNSSEADSEFSVTVEEQDEQDGALLKSVSLYVTLRDLDPDNGITVAEDKFVKTYQASEFTNGPVDLPRVTVTSTFAEAFTALGITMDDFSPGDLFVFELKLELTDGRIFDASSVSGDISGGYFASPFKYNSLIVCTPAHGDYVVEMHDSFGDGWQTDDGNGGSGISIDIDGVIIEVGMCTPYGAGTPPVAGDGVGNDFPCTAWSSTISDPTSEFTDATAIVTIPVGTSSMTWTFPGDEYSEISFEVYAPNGDLLYEGTLGGTAAGLLPITNCL